MLLEYLELPSLLIFLLFLYMLSMGHWWLCVNFKTSTKNLNLNLNLNRFLTSDVYIIEFFTRRMAGSKALMRVSFMLFECHNGENCYWFVPSIVVFVCISFMIAYVTDALLLYLTFYLLKQGDSEQTHCKCL